MTHVNTCIGIKARRWVFGIAKLYGRNLYTDKDVYISTIFREVDSPTAKSPDRKVYRDTLTAMLHDGEVSVVPYNLQPFEGKIIRMSMCRPILGGVFTSKSVAIDDYNALEKDIDLWVSSELIVALKDLANTLKEYKKDTAADIIKLMILNKEEELDDFDDFSIRKMDFGKPCGKKTGLVFREEWLNVLVTLCPAKHKDGSVGFVRVLDFVDSVFRTNLNKEICSPINMFEHFIGAQMLIGEKVVEDDNGMFLVENGFVTVDRLLSMLLVESHNVD